MNINVKTIKHSKQEYPTVGNWKLDKRLNLKVEVSKMNNWRYETLVAIHEIVEAALCRDRGILEMDITNFDINFEQKRKEDNTDEPGDDPKSPYFNEHQFATWLERSVADQLKINWEEYNTIVNNL